MAVRLMLPNEIDEVWSISDTHLGAPNAEKPRNYDEDVMAVIKATAEKRYGIRKWDRCLESIFWWRFWPTHEGVILNGDNFDFANCPKKYLWILRAEFKDACDVYGLRILMGNHECQPGVQPNGDLWHDQTLKLVINHESFNEFSLGFTHLAKEKWGLEKLWTYIRQEHGAGWFKRNLLVRFYAHFRKIWDRKMPEKAIKKAADRCAQLDCIAIHGGHQHPSETHRYIRHAVNIMNSRVQVTVCVHPKGETLVWRRGA